MENPYVQGWDLLIIVCACYNCFVLPIELSFNEAGNMEHLNEMQVVNFFIDALFLFDIILGFRLTYRDEHTNEEITNIKKITRNYLQGNFWIDLVSTIPFDLIVEIASHHEHIKMREKNI